MPDPRPIRDRSGPGSTGSAELAAATLDATATLLIVTEIGTGRVVSMNRAVEDLTGHTRAQVVGRPLWDIASPEHRTMLRRALTDPSGHGLPEFYESTVTQESGNPRRIVWSSTFLTDADGVRRRVVMTGIDMSSEAAGGGLFAHLIQAANRTALVSTDRRGRVTYVSSAAERMLGVRGADLIGRPLPQGWFDSSELRSRAAELRVPSDLMMLTHHHGTPTTAGCGELLQERDWTLVRADGSRLIAHIAVSTARDAEGVHIGYVGMAHDVTERRMANQTLADALATEEAVVRRLHELDQAKRDFVATVSHELRTPTTSIVGCTELLQDSVGGPLSPTQTSLVDSIGRNGERLIALADDLALLALTDVEGLTIDPSEIDLRDVVSRARDALQPLLLHRDLDTSVDMPADPVLVHGDASHLVRAVFNLLSNAVKFTDDGGTIVCRVREQENDTVVEVSDTGVGIPRPEQARLFTRFFRSSTAQVRASPGPGLGLSVVSAIVHEHGGTIAVVSEHLEGCTVTVRLPRAPVRDHRGSVVAFPTGAAVDPAERSDDGEVSPGTTADLLSPACRLFLAASINGRREDALAAVRDALAGGASLLDVYVDIFQSALHEVGRRWQYAGLNVAEEHMVTAATQYILNVLHEDHPRTETHRGVAVVTGVVNEEHVIGASIVADVLDADGWDVRFLGTNLPHDAIVGAISRSQPSLVVISVTMERCVTEARDLIARMRLESAGVPRIIVGGAAFARDPQLWRTVGADGFAADARSVAELARG